jgi:hypothetical protein
LRDLQLRESPDAGQERLQLAAGRGRDRDGAYRRAGHGNPVAAQYLHRFLRDIGSFSLGIAGTGNPLGQNIGALEKATQARVRASPARRRTALGIDYNGYGKGRRLQRLLTSAYRRFTPACLWLAAVLLQRSLRIACVRGWQLQAPDRARQAS